MKKTTLCIALVIGICLKALCQFETDYTPVVSKGELPKDFVTLSSQKYLDEKKELSTEKKRSERKKKEKFLLQSSFSIDDILLSGKVLFNDPLAEYVNHVADEALVSDPKTRKELRFYVLKSTAVNAFSTNQGIVFVTTGMLAQVENEAQLAYVICHEVVHYKEKHTINEYLEADKIVKGKGTYKQLSLDDKIIAKCAFSQEKEKEADEKGIEIFMKSKYSTEHLIGVYDVLKYAYLPFDDVDFDKSFLENSTLKFPDGYILKNTRPIDTKEIMDDDPRSTHPSIKSRREKITQIIANADNSGKSDYRVGEKDFQHIREMARFELCRLYTLHHSYELGIYTSYLLAKKYPNNIYLKKNIAYCLGGLAQYSNQRDFDDVHYVYDSVEGKSQAVFYLMYKLDSAKGDINIVALAYVSKLKAEYPDDLEIDELYRNLMHSLVTTDDMKYSDFSSTAPGATPVAAPTNVVAEKPVEEKTTKEGGEKSKYDKLREQKVEDVKADDTRYTKYAFVEYMDKDWFKNDFEKADKLVGDRKVVDLDEALAIKKKNKKTHGLGLTKLVVVDPYYARINARKKEKYKYLESEGGQVDFAERLKSNAKKAKLGIEVLNTKNLKSSEADKLNDVSLMTDYINDRLGHSKGIDIPYSEKERIRALAQKYGTDYFMWTGTISLTDKNRVNGLLIFYSIIFPPLLPFMMPTIVNGGQYTMYFALVYDVKTDEMKMATYREIQNRTRGYILNSHIYDVFNQLKSKK